MKKIMVVIGTRPEGIKMAPVINELKNRKKFNVIVCTTGQHKEMLQQVFEEFNIKPDYDLSIMQENQTLFSVTSSILLMIQQVLVKENPDLVMVHGDTSTSFVSALSAFYLKIPIAHIEAGLRTGDIYSPFPEEFNRQAISLIATYHFAPTNKAKQNLMDVLVKPENIFITGNTAIDAIKTTINEEFSNDLTKWISNSRLVLLTAHRRENLGAPMEHMFKAIKRIVNEHSDVKVIFPIHLNPKVRETAYKIFGSDDRIKIIEPLDVVQFHNLMNISYLILTDSGGIQEEAPSLGKPVLVMRDTTERPEGILAGTLKLVGTNEDTIYSAFKELLTQKKIYDKMSKSVNPYGDGYASKRIVDVLELKL